MQIDCIPSLTPMWINPNATRPGNRHWTSRIFSDVSRQWGSPLWSGISRMDGLVSPTGSTYQDTPTVSCGGKRPPWSGRANGRHLGSVGGGEPGVRPRFDFRVQKNGYLWWYIDGLSDDGQYGFTVIAFIGSVFSPWYKFARRSGPKDPQEYSCFHVVLYGRGHRRWAMTERKAAYVCRSLDQLGIGPSRLQWTDGTLNIDFNEVSVPIPKRVKGRIRLHTDWVFDRTVHLDSAAQHRWWPITPICRVEVDLDEPNLSWSGDGYFDSNDGDVPLEDSFDYWNWSRAGLSSGAAILYDVVERSGTERGVALRFDKNGTVTDFVPPAEMTDLAQTAWRAERKTRTDTTARVKETLVDAPFYSRSVIESNLLGEPVTAMHECVDMRRFVHPATQFMLPFKVPRRWRFL